MNRFLPTFSFHSKAHQIAVAVIVMSVLQGLIGHSGAYLLLFSPYRTLFNLELWRPFSSLLIAISPAEIIFGTLIIYSLGGMLENRWSTKRFLTVALGIPLIAEVLVLVLAIITPSTFAGAVYPGARQIITTLWIIFGLVSHFSHERLNFWGTPITGKTFALIGLGFVLLNGVFSGVLPVLPDLITALLCYLFMYRHHTTRWKARIRDTLTLGYYDWKLKKLKGRSNLRVVKGARDTRNPSHLADDEFDDEPQVH
jgi:membrane associated rhomboid family serine protease